MEPGIPFQPGFYSGVLMRSVIVDNQMQMLSLRRLYVDFLEKFNKFLMAVSLHALSNHCSVKNIHGGKQGCRSMTDIIVCLTLGNSGRQRQYWPGPIKSLNLALLIKTKYQCFLYPAGSNTNQQCPRAFQETGDPYST